MSVVAHTVDVNQWIWCCDWRADLCSHHESTEDRVHLSHRIEETHQVIGRMIGLDIGSIVYLLDKDCGFAQGLFCAESALSRDR